MSIALPGVSLKIFFVVLRNCMCICEAKFTFSYTKSAKDTKLCVKLELQFQVMTMKIHTTSSIPYKMITINSYNNDYYDVAGSFCCIAVAWKCLAANVARPDICNIQHFIASRF